jgi:hypothetical protein
MALSPKFLLQQCAFNASSIERRRAEGKVPRSHFGASEAKIF